jgi:hypothetical protein
MLDVEPAFHFRQIFVIEVRKANDGADKQEKHGELGVHLLLLICFPQQPNTPSENQNASKVQYLRKLGVNL